MQDPFKTNFQQSLIETQAQAWADHVHQRNQWLSVERNSGYIPLIYISINT